MKIGGYLKLEGYSLGFVAILWAILQSVYLNTIAAEEGYFKPNKNDRQIKQYSWNITKWSLCSSMNCTTAGWNLRKVNCISDIDKQNVDDDYCHDEMKPIETKRCLVKECGNNGAVFSVITTPWGPCEEQRLLNKTSKGYPLRSIHSGMNNSKDLKKENVKLNEVELCNHKVVYFVQNRTLTCYATWINQSIRFEVPLSYCQLNNPVSLRKERICSYSCRESCALTQWGRWNSCTSCRNDVEYRKRDLASLPFHKQKCPSLYQKRRNQKDKEERVGKECQWKVKAWSDCENNGADKNHLIGTKQRSVYCNDRNGKNVEQYLPFDERYSNNETLKTQIICQLEVDCKVGTWSKWSPCLFSNGGLGERLRHRSIEILPSEHGNSCGHLHESMSCLAQLNQAKLVHYKWHTSLWTKCMKYTQGGSRDVTGDSSRHCDYGSQQRSVFCVIDGGDYTPVSDEHCALISATPISKRVCTIHCDSSCELGDWGQWGPCMGPCYLGKSGRSAGTKHRTRKIISHLGDPRACQGYSEYQPCELVNCTSWKIGSSTACLVDDRLRGCGTGRQFRAVYCLNAYGRLTDKTKCDPNELPPSFVECHINCPDDCVMGEWGEWSTCPRLCSIAMKDKTIKQYRTRDLLAESGKSGKKCGESNIEERSCGDHVCRRYSWSTGAWSICLKGQSSTENEDCFIGMKRRNVECVATTTTKEKVNDQFCNPTFKPPGQKQCRVCPVNCSLSTWSDWSACPLSCKGIGDENQIQRRHRTITTMPEDNGLPCSTLVDTTRCDVCRDRTWKVSDWSDCYVLGNDRCHGIRSRTVHCVHRDDLSHSNEAVCLSVIGAKPIASEACSVFCSGGSCQLSEWKASGKCSKRCGKGLLRETREVIGGDKLSCTKKHRLTRTQRCSVKSCWQFTLTLGKWSSCQSTDDRRGCGQGYQWRNLTCKRKDGREVPILYCFESLYQSKSIPKSMRQCRTLCPKDCIMSQWNRWSMCSRSCGNGMATRQRRVIRDASQDGTQCPVKLNSRKQIETRPCNHIKCYHLVWETEKWSTCYLTNRTSDGNGAMCGNGTRNRRVNCIHVPFNSENQTKHDRFCSAKSKPTITETCTMPCPFDCVVGDWSQWSSCTANCPQIGDSRRYRNVLRRPSTNGLSCPILRQLKPCDVRDCPAFKWRYAQWSSCLLVDQISLCGDGMKIRNMECINVNTSEVVPNMHCSGTDETTESVFQSCHVECKRGCPLTQWTIWSGCSDTCAIATSQMRHREVIKPTAANDTACQNKNELEEFRKCPIIPCYFPVMKSWSSCQLEADCGAGVQTRLLSCARDDGKIVNKQMCREIASGRIISTRPCTVKCWDDCLASNWSKWSECLGYCSGNQSTITGTGKQFRTRVRLQREIGSGSKCNRTMKESRTCEPFICYTRSWEVETLANNSRIEWCKRSDGLNLSVGCEIKSTPQIPTKPPGCSPRCTIEHSLCFNGSYCACASGYEPQYIGDSFLMNCIKEQAKVTEGNTGKIDNGINVKTPLVKKRNTRSKGSSFPLYVWVVIGICLFYFMVFVMGMTIIMSRRCYLATRGNRREDSQGDEGEEMCQLESLLTKQPSITVNDETLTKSTASGETNHPSIPRHTKPSISTRHSSMSSGRGSTTWTDGNDIWPDPPTEVLDDKAWMARQRGLNYTGMVYKGSYNDFSEQNQDGGDIASPYDKVDFDDLLASRNLKKM